MKKSDLLDRREVIAPAFLFPVVAYVTLLVGFPFVMAFLYSFSNVTVGNPDFTFVGLRNFVDIIQDPVFRKSLFNTFIFTFVSIGLWSCCRTCLRRSSSAIFAANGSRGS